MKITPTIQAGERTQVEQECAARAERSTRGDGRQTIYFTPAQAGRSIVRFANDWAKQRGLVVRRIDLDRDATRWTVIVEAKAPVILNRRVNTLEEALRGPIPCSACGGDRFIGSTADGDYRHCPVCSPGDFIQA